MKLSARVREAYDEWAPAYDSVRNPTRDLNTAALKAQNLDLSNKVVLEIGCGTGLNTEWLAAARKVVAVDLSDGMIERARARVAGSNVRFVTADVTERWTFADETFDLVVANLILEHVEGLGHIFTEAFNVLRPGGAFYIGELHPYKQLLGSQARYERGAGEVVRIDAVRHSVSEYVNEALEAGFALERLEEWTGEGEPVPRLLTLRFVRPG